MKFYKYAKRLLTEVDWERFKDVQKTVLTAQDVADSLNAELDRLKSASWKRDSADINFPKISKGNIPTDEKGKANVEQFIEDITEEPKTIFDVGEKSKHSVDENTKTINTGIPALRAVFNIFTYFIVF